MQRAIAAAAATLPLAYFLLKSPIGGQSPSGRPAEGVDSTPDARQSFNTEQRLGNEEKARNARSEALGSEQSVGNFRTADSTASVKRGQKRSFFACWLPETDR